MHPDTRRDESRPINDPEAIADLLDEQSSPPDDEDDDDEDDDSPSVIGPPSPMPIRGRNRWP